MQEGFSRSALTEGQLPADGKRRRNGAKGTRWAEILATAERLFSEKGYNATRTEDLASELGMLKGSLYHYISCKEDLLYHILLDINLKSESYLVSRMTSVGDPRKRLLHALELNMEYVMQHPKRIALYLREINALTGERRRRVLDLARRFEGYFVDLIRQGQEQGCFLQADAEVMMQGMLNMCISAHALYEPGVMRVSKPQQIKQTFLRLLSEGFTSRNWSGQKS